MKLNQKHVRNYLIIKENATCGLNLTAKIPSFKINFFF